MNTDGLKRTVIQRRTSNQTKLGNLLAKAIEAFEKSRITSDRLKKYYRELQSMAK